MTKEYRESFGAHLRRLRESSRLPLRKVAYELNVDLSLLAKIERNERKPTRQLIKSFAELFQQDEQKLFISYLSDQIVYQVLDEENGIKVLKVAEQKVRYLVAQQRKKDRAKSGTGE